MKKTHDLGWLKRVDRGDGTSDVLDAFGAVVATVKTSAFPVESRNLDVARFRMMEERVQTDQDEDV